MRARRENVRRQTRRRNRRRAISTMLLAVLVALAIVVGRSPLFAISEVRVEGVDKELADKVLAAASVREGQNLFAANLAAARARVEDLSWVQQAQIDQVPPSAVVVAVQQRDAAAIVRTETASWLIDDDALLFAGGERDGVPVIVAPDLRPPPLGQPMQHDGVRAALAVIAELPAGIADRVVRYELDGAHVTALLDTADALPAQPELRVDLGSSRRIAEKASVVRAMLDVIAERQADEKEPGSVLLDVSAPENPVLRPI